jgi:hypothetical protein
MSNTLQDMAENYSTSFLKPEEKWNEDDEIVFHIRKSAFIAGLEQSGVAGLVSAAENLLHLHLCEQEGLQSGQPTREQWLKAVDDISEAISHFKEGKDGLKEFNEWLDEPSQPLNAGVDMTAEEFYKAMKGIITIDFLNEEEKQTIYQATELYAKGKIRQMKKQDDPGDSYQWPIPNRE